MHERFIQIIRQVGPGNIDFVFDALLGLVNVFAREKLYIDRAHILA